MIKRRFFKHEHGDKDAPSDSSSSSDDSEAELESTDEEEVEVEEEQEEQDEEEEEEDDHVVAPAKHSKNVPPSSSSGYESEESSAHEVDLDSLGQPSSEDELDSVDKKKDFGVSHLPEKRISGKTEKLSSTVAEKDEIPSDMPSCVLKTKSVFKCKICPRIICLTEETLRTHLKSKRHARSEKLLREGRLKVMLNSDGELETPFEEEGETHQERHAATLAAAAQPIKSKKKNRGRQRQRERAKKKAEQNATSEDKKSSAKPHTKLQKAGQDVTSKDKKSPKNTHKKRRQN